MHTSCSDSCKVIQIPAGSDAEHILRHSRELDEVTLEVEAASNAEPNRGSTQPRPPSHWKRYADIELHVTNVDTDTKADLALLAIVGLQIQSMAHCRLRLSTDCRRMDIAGGDNRVHQLLLALPWATPVASAIMVRMRPRCHWDAARWHPGGRDPAPGRCEGSDPESAGSRSVHRLPLPVVAGPAGAATGSAICPSASGPRARGRLCLEATLLSL